MPELPEVETIARGLAPLLAGRRIARLEVLDRRAFPGDQERFALLFAGRRIEGVTRRGKLCILRMEGGGTIGVHLRMTGRLFVDRPRDPAPAHLRLLLHLDDGRALHFSDLRRFGSVNGFAPGELEAWPFYAALGPEPLDLSPDAFRQALAGRGGAVKAVLLDQRVLAGVGNIYADESLFAARIRPCTPARDIPPERLDALLEALTATLLRAIDAGGSTIRDYRTAQGVEGSFQWTFAVYGRAGQPCTACGKPLFSARVAGRSTVFCTHCQPGACGT
uniref:Formamidopyrimidine-DNA glycosylase n=1 Tax=Fundidesulfovibrio putealis TaxID=270496 RepID=A0A7C3W8C9_9BACT